MSLIVEGVARRRQWVCGSMSFDRASLRPITQLLPSFILIKAEQARTLALHDTMRALASEMAEQVPGSEIVANRLAEVLFIQILRAHIASGPERKKGWLRAIFDPQMGTALSAIHDCVNTPWTVESLAEAAGMSRSAFAARFKELLGQTPLEYVTEWRMQKAMQLLQQRDKKLIDVARSVGYESGAAFSKAFKRVVGINLVNTSKVVLKATVMPESRKILEEEDSDFGGGAQATPFPRQATAGGQRGVSIRTIRSGCQISEGASRIILWNVECDDAQELLHRARSIEIAIRRDVEMSKVWFVTGSGSGLGRMWWKRY